MTKKRNNFKNFGKLKAQLKFKLALKIQFLVKIMLMINKALTRNSFPKLETD